MQEQPESAQQTYLRALAVDPQFADALNNLGLLLRDRGRFVEAVERFQAAIDADRRTEVYVNLALTLDDADGGHQWWVRLISKRSSGLLGRNPS